MFLAFSSLETLPNLYFSCRTVLMVEEPFVSILKDSLNWDMKHCHFCLRKILRGIPCSTCAFVIYCNDECRDKALEEFHHFECPCLPFLHSQCTPRYALLTLRIVFKLGPEKLFNIFTNQVKSFSFDQKQIKVLLESGKDANSDAYVPIHQLVSHPSQLDPLEIYSNTLNALILTHVLTEQTNFFDKIESNVKNNFIEFVASIILLHLENVPCNSIAMEELEGLENVSLNNDMPHKKLAELIRFIKYPQYASGVYAVSSLMNHSCDPNVTRVHSLSHGKLAIVATRTLKKDEEIVTSYSKSFIHDELEKRQCYLLDNYYFTCECIACKHDWPQLTEMMVSSQPNFCCLKCSSEMYYDEKASPKFQQCILTVKNNYTCRLCKQHYPPSNLKLELDKNIELYFQAYDLVLRNMPLNAIRSLTTPLKFYQNNIAHPCNKYHMLQGIFKQALELIIYFS